MLSSGLIEPQGLGHRLVPGWMVCLLYFCLRLSSWWFPSLFRLDLLLGLLLDLLCYVLFIPLTWLFSHFDRASSSSC